MASSTPVTKVLVTGATGFLATHIVKQLLETGVAVKGTVRSLANGQKVQPVKDLCPAAAEKLELVEATLEEKECWLSAVEGCSHVVHTASPFPKVNPRDENEIIQPAVNGTINVLEACRARGVKRVVLTSSMAAVVGGREVAGSGGPVFTEDTWSDVPSCNAYYKSKTLAEKAAWDFVEKLQGDEKMELVVMNPSFIMGPMLTQTPCTSIEVPVRMLTHDMIALPRLNYTVIDVRDVAAAHIAGLTSPDAVGKRHLLGGESCWMKDIALVIDEEFGPQGYSIPTKTAPDFVVKVIAVCDKTVRMIVPDLNKTVDLDTTRMKEALGVTPRPVRETILDTCYSCIEKGFVKKTSKYRGAPSSQQ